MPTKSTFKYKDLFFKLENALIYIGYGLGLLLTLEYFKVLISDSTSPKSNVLYLAVFLWFIGFIVRTYIFKASSRTGKSLNIKLGVELLYFFFCITYLTVFMPILVYKSPFGPPDGYKMYKSDLITYLGNEFLYYSFVNILLVLVFAVITVIFSEIIVQWITRGHALSSVYSHKANTLRIFVIGLFFVLMFILLQVPAINTAYNGMRLVFVEGLKVRFSGIADFVLGSPLVYYLYASFRGSVVAEEFALLGFSRSV